MPRNSRKEFGRGTFLQYVCGNRLARAMRTCNSPEREGLAATNALALLESFKEANEEFVEWFDANFCLW